MARTSRILNAHTLDELVGETADAARRMLRAARAVAFVQTDDVRLCCGRSPRWPVDDTAEPTRAVPLIARDGHRLGAPDLTRQRLTREDDEVLQQIAHCRHGRRRLDARSAPHHDGALITHPRVSYTISDAAHRDPPWTRSGRASTVRALPALSTPWSGTPARRPGCSTKSRSGSASRSDPPVSRRATAPWHTIRLMHIHDRVGRNRRRRWSTDCATS
jgi:hypothetical protein